MAVLKVNLAAILTALGLLLGQYRELAFLLARAWVRVEMKTGGKRRRNAQVGARPTIFALHPQTFSSHHSYSVQANTAVLAIARG